jgi:hypothetical protein
MKAATDMTEKQLISWLRKTEATGNRELYRSGMSSNYELLRARWEDLVEEIDKRGTELEDGKPDIYGENEGYTWGDVTC